MAMNPFTNPRPTLAFDVVVQDLVVREKFDIKIHWLASTFDSA